MNKQGKTFVPPLRPLFSKLRKGRGWRADTTPADLSANSRWKGGGGSYGSADDTRFPREFAARSVHKEISRKENWRSIEDRWKGSSNRSLVRPVFDTLDSCFPLAERTRKICTVTRESIWTVVRGKVFFSRIAYQFIYFIGNISSVIDCGFLCSSSERNSNILN